MFVKGTEKRYFYRILCIIEVMKAQTFLDYLASEGRFSFTLKELKSQLQLGVQAARNMLSRLKKKEQICSPVRGYYLVLTPEFRRLGCLPPDFFIDNLMQYLNMDYYVALLSAALYHGAAHQQPQIFQIMVNKARPSVECGQVRIQFIKNKNLNEGETSLLKTRTGTMCVSTPESTVRDLLNFQGQSGGIGQIATVINELAEILGFERLKELTLKSQQYQWIQRLGYLLEMFEYNELAESLYSLIETKKLRVIGIVSQRTITGFPRDRKWRVAKNAIIESDLDNDTY